MVYRAVDSNKRVIDGGRASDPTKARRLDAEFTSSSPTKVEHLMKPVRQQSALHASYKPLSPTKSAKLRHSYVQGNGKDHRATPGLNEAAGSLHSQSVASSAHNGGPKASERGVLDNYESRQNFASTSKSKHHGYRTSDERNQQVNYSVDSVNETGEGEGLAEIQEEKAYRDQGRNQAKGTSPGKVNTAPSRQSKHGVNEEPEAEAKT